MSYKKVDELLKRENDDFLSSIEVDILRALVILHGSAWQSDLMDTLSGLWRLKGLGLDAMVNRARSVSEAIKKLNELDLVESETRSRGDLSRQGPVDDKLYSTKGLWHINSILSGDSLIHRYRREVMSYESSRL